MTTSAGPDRLGPGRRPVLGFQIGRDSFVPQHRFLTLEEAVAVGEQFRRRHPWRVRMVRRALGVDLRSDAAMREFLSTRPLVGLRPVSPAAPPATPAADPTTSRRSRK